MTNFRHVRFSSLVIRPVVGGSHCVTAEPFTAWFEGGRVEVPKGFMSDYASVPRLLWRILPPHMHPKASILHDFLYSVEWRGSRADCDALFRAALLADDASKGAAWAYYIGVRIGGWATWALHDPEHVRILRAACRESGIEIGQEV
jgi:hypothetical protein